MAADCKGFVDREIYWLELVFHITCCNFVVAGNALLYNCRISVDLCKMPVRKCS